MATKKRRFGELLLDKGLITQEKLDDALRKQVGSKRKLGETLLLLGYITETQLTRMIGDLAGIPAVDLKKFKLEKDAAHYLTGDFCARNRVVPIAVKSHNKRDHLLVAFADPLNLDTVDELRFIVNMPIFRVTATSEAIKDAIKQLYPLSDPTSTIPGELPVSKETGPAMEIFHQGEYRHSNESAQSYQEATSGTDVEKLYLEILTLKKSIELLVKMLSSKKMLTQEEVINLQKYLK